MSDKQIFLNHTISGVVRHEELNNKQHLVFPTVAAKVGVMNGLLYSEHELSNFSESWNGVPVPVGHPTINGEFVSANSPDIESTKNIGKFYNVSFSDNSLKGEIWLNIEKATNLNYVGLVNRLEKGEVMEVSTGLMCKTVPETGMFGNKEYKARATSIRPDHLALLPNEVGACSVAQGCGTMRANCGDCSCKKTNVEKLKEAFSLLGEKLGFKGNVTSFNVIREQLESLMSKEFDINGFFITDLNEDFFVYEQGSRFFKRNYSVIGDVVSLGDGAQEVARTTDYVVIGNDNKEKGENLMNKEETVKKIIANKSNDFTGSDSDLLQAMDDKVLSKFLSNEDEEGDVAPELAKEASEEDKEKKENDKEVEPKDLGEKADEVVSNIKDPELQEFIANAVSAQKLEKKSLIESIKTNSSLLDEDLRDLSLDSLKRYKSSFVKNTPSFKGRGSDFPTSGKKVYASTNKSIVNKYAFLTKEGE